jgi:hypothetical protein
MLELARATRAGPAVAVRQLDGQGSAASRQAELVERGENVFDALQESETPAGHCFRVPADGTVESSPGASQHRFDIQPGGPAAERLASARWYEDDPHRGVTVARLAMIVDILGRHPPALCPDRAKDSRRAAERFAFDRSTTSTESSARPGGCWRSAPPPLVLQFFAICLNGGNHGW